MTYSKTRPFRFKTQLSFTDTTSTTTTSHISPTGYDDFFTGELNPFWKNQIARRENATTPCTGRLSAFRAISPAVVRTVTVSNNQQYDLMVGYHASWTPHQQVPLDIKVSVDNRALGAFINKCVGIQRSFSGGVFLGELREAIALLRKPAQALRRGFTDYYKAATSRSAREARKYGLSLGAVNRKSPRKLRSSIDKVLSATYLEGVFGWLPLYSDVLSAADALTSYYPNDSETVQVTVEDPYAYISSEMGVTRGSIRYNYRVYEVGQYSCRYKGAVWIVPPYLSSAGNMSRWGFDPIRDFVPTLWELIPYSFLVDYFTNIGDIVQSATFLRSNVAWWCKTSRDTSLKQPRDFRIRPSSALYKLTSSQPEGWGFETKLIGRSKPTTTIPSLEFTLPGNTRAWLNIAALADIRRPVKR